MTFTLAVSVCLVLCYFGFVAKRGESYAYSSYIWLAIAFLIKGPPVLVFFGTGALYWLWRSKWPRESLTLHFRGMLLALAILGPWFFALWGRVGLEEIARVLRVEVIDRFLGDPRAGEQSRGAFFYAISIFSGLLPWSAIFLAWLPTLRRPRSSDFSYVAPDLFRFVLAVSIPSIIFFSFSSGKSARYLLPLFPLLSVFILECAREIWISGGEKMLRFTSQILGLSLIGASIAAPLLQPGALNSVNSDRLLLSLLPCGIFGGIFAFASHRERQYGPWIFALVLLFISIRIPFYFLYVPLRNETNTVKPLVHEIEAVLPPGHPLYTLEMFERWVNYYAARDGIPSYRLTPRLVTELKSRSPGERIYVLLNEANESWRLIQLAPIMQEVKTEALLKHGRHPLRLISIPAREAYRFDPTQDFPTSYSKPEITEPVTITLPDRVV